MSTLSLRLSERLDANLAEESRQTGKSKSLVVRDALEQYLADQRQKRFLGRLSRAAAAINTDDVAVLVEEALPFDNEALELAERGTFANPSSVARNNP